MHLGLGALPPQKKIVVQRGASTPWNPRTDVAKRCWERSHQKVSHDLTTLKLIPFSEIHRRLLALNSHMFFVPIGDGRVGIGVETPSACHIAVYEKLSYYERKEIDSHREFSGPRVLLVCASENAVDPYTELMSLRPRRVIARSLRSIIRACVEGSAFTWQAAEKEFGMPFEHMSVTTRVLDMSPSSWHSRRSAQIAL